MTLNVKLIFRLVSSIVKEPLLSAVIQIPVKFFIIEMPESQVNVKSKARFSVWFNELTKFNLKQEVFELTVKVLLLKLQFETHSML